MEQALINADFAGNRRFLSWLLPDEPSDSILPEYAEDIDCWNGDIPHTFFNLREQAETKARGLIERLAILATIANTDDPLVAVEGARDITSLDGSHGEGFYSEDFERSIRREKQWYERLSKAGLLLAHSSLKEFLKQEIIDDSTSKIPFSANDLYGVEVRYDIHTLELISFTTRIADKSTTSLNVRDSYSNEALGIYETPCGISSGFINWSRFFLPTDERKHVIPQWVETLVRYMMSDILDSVPIEMETVYALKWKRCAH
jgi:hypothetical protein